MIFRTNSTLAVASLFVLASSISGCGGGSSGDSATTDPDSGSGSTEITKSTIDVSQASIVTEGYKLSGGIAGKSASFSFPETSIAENTFSFTIPADPLPSFEARRTVKAGTGNKVEYGDTVSLKYDMFSWSDGVLVDSSKFYDEAHTVKAGMSDSYPVPAYLVDSLLGRSLGDVVQVILPTDTKDLPSSLDSGDAYVLVVELM